MFLGEAGSKIPAFLSKIYYSKNEYTRKHYSVFDFLNIYPHYVRNGNENYNVNCLGVRV